MSLLSILGRRSRNVRRPNRESVLNRAVAQALESRMLMSASLQFVTMPTSGNAGAVLNPPVEVQLINGPANDTNAVTLSITFSNGNATTATLGGTVTENLTQGLVNGQAATIATFPSNLSISQAGSYTLTATDATDGASVQDTPITIAAVATTTTITSSANPATAGNDLTLTFTVSPTSSTNQVPAGYVNITDTNGTHNTSLPLNSAGQAQLIVYGGLPVGSDTFNANYQGDPSFTGSSATPFVQSTVQYATTTTITSSADPATNGADLTLTFTVASTTQGVGTPAGYVNISDTSGNHDTSLLLNSSGQATLVIFGGLPVGMDNFTASYAGDPAFLPSSGMLNESTVQYATTTAVTSSSNPATQGADLTLTFTVTSNTSGVGTPAGYVNITDSNGHYNTNIQLNNSGVGTLVVFGGLALGSDTFTANYLGDAAFLVSTGKLVQSTVQYATTTAITSSANPATDGNDLTLTFTVTSNTSGVGTPAGYVAISDTLNLHDTSLQLNNSGQAQLVVFGGLPLGMDTFTATYQGDPAFLSSTGHLTQSTVQYNTTTTITSSSNPATQGADLTLTFTVASTTQGVGTPAGYVNISDTLNAHDTSLPLNNSGQAQLVVYGGLPLGTDTFTASYAGDPAFLASTGHLTQSTVQYNTTTTITSSSNPATQGADLTLTFTVASTTQGVGTPAGYVNISDTSGNHDTSLQLNNSGQAQLIIYGGLPLGSDTFTASYAGDPAFVGSSSAQFVQQTVQYNTTTAITSSANPATAGDDLTLTFTVTSTTQGVGTPAGNVLVYDSLGKVYTNVSLTSGVGTLIVYTGLPLGSDTFTAVYQGDAAFVTSTSPQFVQQTDQYGTTTTITSSANPAVVGNDLTLTFTVASTTSGVTDKPQGYVNISDTLGAYNTSLQLNAAGQATLIVYGGLPLGSDTFSATYQGDPGFTGSSATPFAQQTQNAGSGIVVSNGGAYNFSGPTGGQQTLNVTAGTVTLTSDLSTSYPNYILNIATGANVVLGAPQHVGGITLAGTGTLDLVTYGVIINYGSLANDPVNSITTALTSGAAYSGTTDKWTGTGIKSSTAAGSNNKYSVGILDGDKAADSFYGTVAPNQIIVAYTLNGNAFLENSVGFRDLLTIAQDYGLTGKDWAQGAMDYTRSVGFGDLLAVAQNYQKPSGLDLGSAPAAQLPLSDSTTPATAASPSSVPPASTPVADDALVGTLDTLSTPTTSLFSDMPIL